jgi:lysophospholipase L1-like esterase
MAALATIGVALCGSLGAGGTTSAGAATPASAFYLAIGGSASVGVQPTTIAPFGQPTSDGYANDLVSLEATNGLSLQLDQIGCPGETTTTMLRGGKSCYQSPNSQLSAAILFLGTHQADSGVVTIDLGFNNVVHCLKNLNVVNQCVNQGLSQLRNQLPQILTDLEVVAGPNVSFVGVGHYDPFLANALNGPNGQLEAAKSLQIIGRLNRALSAVFQAQDITMANVASAFQSADTQLVALAGFGMVPQNVTNICAMTWMCQAAPLVANLHPNDLGYQAIALAIEAKVPASL